MNYAIWPLHCIHLNDFRRIYKLLAGFLTAELDSIAAQSAVMVSRGVTAKIDSVRDNVVKQESLERLEIARFKQEPLELGIKITFESFIFRSEDGDVVFTNSVFEGL